MKLSPIYQVENPDESLLLNYYRFLNDEGKKKLRLLAEQMVFEVEKAIVTEEAMRGIREDLRRIIEDPHA